MSADGSEKVIELLTDVQSALTAAYSCLLAEHLISGCLRSPETMGAQRSDVATHIIAASGLVEAMITDRLKGTP